MRSATQSPSHGSLPATGLAAVLVTVLGLAPAALAQDQPGSRHWVATWAVSPQRAAAPTRPSTARPCGRSCTSAWEANTIRVRLSNAYGTSSAGDWRGSRGAQRRQRAIAAGTDRLLTFGGSPTITIPAGALAVSDPVALAVPDLGDVAVSLYLPDDVAATTYHETALHTTYLSPPGDFTVRRHHRRHHHGVLLFPVGDGGPGRQAGASDRGAGRFGH